MLFGLHYCLLVSGLILRRFLFVKNVYAFMWRFFSLVNSLGKVGFLDLLSYLCNEALVDTETVILLQSSQLYCCHAYCY